MLLKIDYGKFCVLRACPLQGPTMSCTLIAPRSLDRRTTPPNQLYSSELPMYSYWVVFPLEWSISHIIFPYVSGLVSQTFLVNAHDWPLFTRTGQDLVRLFIQLSVHSSCDRVEWCRLQTMRGQFFPLGERLRILPSEVSGCPVSPVHILQYLSFLCTWGNSCVRNPLLCMGWW